MCDAKVPQMMTSEQIVSLSDVMAPAMTPPVCLREREGRGGGGEGICGSTRGQLSLRRAWSLTARTQLDSGSGCVPTVNSEAFLILVTWK